MGKIFFLSFLLVALGWPGTENDCRADKRLSALIDSLPANWKYEVSTDTLRFFCADSVYRVFANHVNEMASGEEISEEDRISLLRKEGKKPGLAYVMFKMEPRWSDDKIKSSLDKNVRIYKELGALPARHRVADLQDNFRSRKEGPVFNARTPEEQERVKAYEEAAKQVSSGLVRLPDYCTEKYSLFRIAESGRNSAFEDVYPQMVSRQLYHIFSIMTDNCSCR